MSFSAVFLFSGQGSQYFHMGKALFEGNRTFRESMQRLDEMARPAVGQSVLAALYSDSRGKGDPFDRLLLSHPAIFMVEYSLAQCLIEAGIVPDMVLGTSLGSFAAAALAGCVTVEEGLGAAIQQAIALEQGCEAGGMTAILGDPAMFSDDFMASRSELAAVNFASHFVISAKRNELVAIEATLKQRNIGFQRLPVQFPFHSRWMDNARAAYEPFLRSLNTKQATMPLVCCDRGTVISSLGESFFWDVVRNPIRFRETIARLEEGGPRRYIDVGPAGTLATFLKYGLPANSGSKLHSILTPFGADAKNLAAVVAAIGN